MVRVVVTLVSMSCMFMALAEQSFSTYLLNEEEDNLNLLQLRSVAKSVAHVATNSSRLLDSPEARERQQCPHEIEAELAARGDKRFGCRGTFFAQSTRKCGMWGEPHMSNSWVTQMDGNRFDVFTKAGLFRMAAAQDGSWEIQVFNCGIFISAMAARFGTDVIEVVSEGPNSLGYFLNGKRMQGDFPHELGSLFIDGTHRKSRNGGGEIPAPGQVGACIDDPGSQIYIDINQEPGVGNLGILLEAATDSYTTAGTDGFSVCNVDLKYGRGNTRMHNWHNPQVSAEDSLFISTADGACAQCFSPTMHRWGGYGVKKNQVAQAQATCASLTKTELDEPDTQQMCEGMGIALADAEAACVHLQDVGGVYYNDCQFDFCAEDGNPVAVAGAEAEEHAENPQPTCAVADDACDPVGACCNALKDNAILSFGRVTQNNLCGDDAGARELRYGSVLTQRGQSMDLVVTPVDDYDCGHAVNNKNGNKGDAVGLIALQAGMTVSFNFQFVSSGTDDPITPSSLMFSFLDIDQGKKNKQRESVEVCGAVNAIVTDNSELEQSSAGDCIKFTSTTHGTGQDNPDDPESMSDTQRARTVAYQVAGSQFTATLGVSKKGNNARKFMFAGNPSVACVLKE